MVAFFDLSNLFAILVLFAGVTTLQFFYGRKINIFLMKGIVEELEETVKPKDQLYTWLGGYVGFKAEYRIDNPDIDTVEVTLTLLPRQSILYMPISKLTLKDDRLFFVLKCRHAVKGDIHAVKKGIYRFTKPIDNEIEYRAKAIRINGEEFVVYYRRKEDVDRLLKHMKNLPVKDVKHISITPSTRVVYTFVTPRKGVVGKVFPRIMEIARDFTGF